MLLRCSFWFAVECSNQGLHRCEDPSRELSHRSCCLESDTIPGWSIDFNEFWLDGEFSAEDGIDGFFDAGAVFELKGSPLQTLVKANGEETTIAVPAAVIAAGNRLVNSGLGTSFSELWHDGGEPDAGDSFAPMQSSRCGIPSGLPRSR